MDPQHLSRLIGAVYDCAFDPNHWEATLAQIAGPVRACNGQIMSRDSAGLSFAATWGTTEDDRRIYHERYARSDPFATVDWHFDVDDPITTGRIIPLHELQATPSYQEYLKPRGWLDFVLTLIEKSATRVTMFGFTRHESVGPFGEAEIALMRLLSPHVRRSVMFSGILATAPQRAQDLAATLDALAAPVVLVDRDGRGLEANRAATALFGERLGDKALMPGLFGAQNPPAAEPGTTSGSPQPPDANPVEPASIPFTDAHGRAQIAHVLPLAAQHTESGHAAAAVFVQAVGALAPLPGELLVRLYGLTPAETRLAALLARDHALEEAAAALGIAVSTARTHLSRVFAKTGTARQAELVRLILSALPPGPGAG